MCLGAGRLLTAGHLIVSVGLLIGKMGKSCYVVSSRSGPSLIFCDFVKNLRNHLFQALVKRLQRVVGKRRAPELYNLVWISALPFE